MPFTFHGKGTLFMHSPPFSVTQRVLQNISEDETTGLLVVPHWPTDSDLMALSNEYAH